MTDRSRWPFGVVIAAPLVLFAPFLLGRQVLYWGTPLLQFVPWRAFALEALRAGSLPLWNPYLGNGAPLIANYQSAVFYPPNWLALLLPLDVAQAWIVTLHLVWAGAGMLMLGRQLGLGPLGQAVAGLAFGLSQYLVARAGFFSINAAAAWLPWVLLWVERGLGPAASWRREVPGLALCLALQLLAGHAQTTWYTLALAGLWAVWQLAGGLTWRQRLSGAARLAAAGALALGMAALQLLPTAELLGQSQRATAADYEFVVTYSFSPWRLLTLLAPDLLGNPARGQFYGYGNYWEDAVYVGVLPLLLALGMLIGALRPGQVGFPRRRVGRAAVSMLAALLIGLGRNTPVFPFLYAHVPTFDLFQAPARLMLWLVFELALLGGMGAERWRPPRGGGLYWTRLGAAGAVAMALVGGAAWLALQPGETRLAQQLLTVARAAALAGGLLFAVAALSLLQQPLRDRGWGAAWIAAVVLLVAGDLLLANAGLNPGAAPELYRQPTAVGMQLRAALDGHRLFQFPDDEHRVKFDQFFSFLRFGPPQQARAVREAQLPNISLLDGLASASNFDPLVPARYLDLVEVVSATQSVRLLALMDVGVVASGAPRAWPEVAQGGPVTFYRVPAEPRRVRTAYTARSVPDAASALRAISDPAFDPDREVILEADNSGMSLDRAACPALTGPPNALTIQASLVRPGWVVVSDTYYPGWQVDVDGQPAPLLHANYAFRAVAVEAGEHQVTFCYRPISFVAGAWLSGAAWLLWVVLAVAGWRQRKA